MNQTAELFASPDELAEQEAGAVEEDQANLKTFLKEAVGEDELESLGEMSRLQFHIQTPILIRLHKIEYDPAAQTDKDRLLAALEDNNYGQIVKTAAEGRDVQEGPKRRLGSAAAKGTSAGISKFQAMQDYVKDALADMKLLNQVRVAPENDTFRPDGKSLRDNRAARNVIGDHLMHREFLDNMKWPKKTDNLYKQRQAYWRGAVMAASLYSDVEFLDMLIEHEVADTKRRLRYLSEKIEDVSKSAAGVAVRSAIDERKAAPPEAPGVTRIPVKVEEDSEAREQTETDWWAKVPEAAKAEAAQKVSDTKYADRDKKIQTRIRQGITPHVAEIDELGGRALRDPEGNIIGVEGSDKQPRGITINPRRPRQTIRNLSNKEKGQADLGRSATEYHKLFEI